jgi:hypothetical protein
VGRDSGLRVRGVPNNKQLYKCFLVSRSSFQLAFILTLCQVCNREVLYIPPKRVRYVPSKKERKKERPGGLGSWRGCQNETYSNFYSCGSPLYPSILKNHEAHNNACLFLCILFILLISRLAS